LRGVVVAVVEVGVVVVAVMVKQVLDVRWARAGVEMEGEEAVGGGGRATYGERALRL